MLFSMDQVFKTQINVPLKKKKKKTLVKEDTQMFCSLWFYKPSKANLCVHINGSTLRGGEHYTSLISFIMVI